MSPSYQTYFGFPGSDLNLDCGLRDHVITRFASVFHYFGIVPLFRMKLEDQRIILYTYQLLILKPPNNGLVFRIVDLQSSSVPSPLVNT